MSDGPSAHLSWKELECHDGTPYPVRWRASRAAMLAETFEKARLLLGGVPIVILSGYRTAAYNMTLEGAASKSQHIEGRALDIWHPAMEPREIWLVLHAASRDGRLPLLGGLGLYRSFLHLDVRPKVPVGHMATWAGTGVELP